MKERTVGDFAARKTVIALPPALTKMDTVALVESAAKKGPVKTAAVGMKDPLAIMDALLENLKLLQNRQPVLQQLLIGQVP